MNTESEDIIDDFIKYSIKKTVIGNAKKMGWSVCIVGNNKCIIKKKINKMSESEKSNSYLFSMLFDINSLC